MNAELLMRAVGYISDETIADADIKSGSQPKRYICILVAACICVAVLGVIAVPVWHENSVLEQTPEAQNIVQETVVVSGMMAEFTMEDLVEQSSLIISGVITGKSDPIEIRPASGADSSLFTDWTVEIDSVYRGKLQAGTIAIRMQGGENERLKVIHENAPDFSVGDQIVVCLYQPNMGGNYNTEGDYYYLTGLAQGAYKRVMEDSLINYYSRESCSVNEFLSEVATWSERYEVDENWLYHYNQEHTSRQLENDGITQKEYDEFWERMSQYAEIVNE